MQAQPTAVIAAHLVINAFQYGHEDFIDEPGQDDSQDNPTLGSTGSLDGVCVLQAAVVDGAW